MRGRVFRRPPVLARGCSCTPKDSTIASVMKSMVLAGAGADLSSLEMSEVSENTIRYEFKNQKYPEELSADEKQNFVIE